MFLSRSILVLVLTALPAAPALAEPESGNVLEGTASVIDGDTIEIHGQRIRLNGFDTPERGSVCGKVNVYQKAALALSDFIGAKTVSCKISGQDRYERNIGTCSSGSEDLGDFMVATGWGRDWPKYSKGAYAGAETRARAAGAGIWGLVCSDDLWSGRTYE